MTALPDFVKDAWKNRDSFPVFTTTDKAGVPNSVYVSILDLYDDSTIVIADNAFFKTKKNIESGSTASLLFISKDFKAFQIKGSIEYATSGPLFDFMKTLCPKEYPGKAAAAIKVEEVYGGAEKLAGQ